MASHDLSNTKTAILGATPGAIPRIDENPHERFTFAPSFSERFFENWGGPRAQFSIWIARFRPSKVRASHVWHVNSVVSSVLPGSLMTSSG